MSSFRQDIQSNFIPRYGAVAQLIVLNVGIYVAVGLVGLMLLFVGQKFWFFYGLQEFLMFPSDAMAALTRPWTIVTYGFLHTYPGMGRGFFLFHILFNMLWLYWMGRILREYMGDRAIWSAYMLGVVGGALLYLLVFNLSPEFTTGSRLIGASAGVSAIVLATATLVPNYRIGLLFFGLVQLKWLALVFVVIDLLSVMGGGNAGGSVAHLGGAFIGYLYITQNKRGVDLARPFEWFWERLSGLFTRRRKPAMQVSYRRGGPAPKGPARSRAAAPDGPTQDDIDIILEKIQKHGYEKLSKAEKQALLKFGQGKP